MHYTEEAQAQEAPSSQLSARSPRQSVDSTLPDDLSAMAPALVPDENLVDDDDRSIMSIDDIDSALGDICNLSTASLRSSIVRAREENGRQYHGYKEGRYVLPTDAPELDRQDFQYELCLATFDNRLHLAPINRPHRVLDAGCGLGRWVTDFATEHPESKVVGVDLAPVQPTFTLPNVSFEIDDLEEAWSFSSNFDYVHAMMMTGAFRDWPRFIKQSFEYGKNPIVAAFGDVDSYHSALNPGGWLEIQDIDFPIECDDGSIPNDSYLRRWSDLMMEAAETSGFLLNTCGKVAQMMSDNGFVDIMRVPFKWPLNQWPASRKHKILGDWTQFNFSVGMEAMSLALFTRFLGWSRQEVLEFVPFVINEWRDLRRHGYFNLYITYGRRP